MATAAAQPNPASAVEKTSPATSEELSFTMNLFRGHIEGCQVFPYPEALTTDQTDTIKMLVDPVQKFFEVCMYFNVLFKFMSKFLL